MVCCPPGPNPDADFGEAPMMLTINNRGEKHDIVVTVQKSGFAWAMDRDNGSIVWSTQAGPGGIDGGGTWGSATDGTTVYTNIGNSLGNNFTLKPSNITANSGGWVSIDATTGNVLWSTANPSNASAIGPVSVANGVVFAGSTNGTGPIYAINAATGQILWSYNTGGTVYGGMSISDGCVYVGSGYKTNVGLLKPSFTPGDSLFAFCV
ncbi:putative polyvinyl alcohol dehydrogenase (cytochrome) [Helianthus annuus]|uniref:Polyvinyl alcohol dehydrogenase (Cytochrome) n=1 Tax=Helianthus annuus TaxID=4232 RepID=A0A251SWZ2_HELAN|nr:putative polyvinyl alcohol dehydrogenase (cytochrome) [Helianthus annuus]